MRALALTVFVACFVVAFGQTCTPTLDKVEYNFTALRNGGKNISGDYFLPTHDFQDWDVYVNFCGGVNAAYCGTDCTACQVYSYYFNGYACLGRWSSITWSVVSGKPTARLRGDGGRNMKMTFTCVPGEGNGSPQYIKESPPLQYNFEWSTASACAANGTTASSSSDASRDIATAQERSGELEKCEKEIEYLKKVIATKDLLMEEDKAKMIKTKEELAKSQADLANLRVQFDAQADTISKLSKQ
eukprot:TRINITY_DN43813_c0_g3_i6.p1 TRINITY_DN43813_c0_g3~~TRINITY_DN43813_c0_g3_i6.p1  ORF type:complete len:251 (-),score=22.37 TRINITY_DN43813_c0_g3_i6:119-850(-)